jgi:hypothetical protein
LPTNKSFLKYIGLEVYPPKNNAYGSPVLPKDLKALIKGAFLIFRIPYYSPN